MLTPTPGWPNNGGGGGGGGFSFPLHLVLSIKFTSLTWAYKYFWEHFMPEKNFFFCTANRKKYFDSEKKQHSPPPPFKLNGWSLTSRYFYRMVANISPFTSTPLQIMSTCMILIFQIVANDNIFCTIIYQFYF